MFQPSRAPLSHLMLSTTLSYTSLFMKPVSGEKPPTVSSSTSHALRSEHSCLCVALAISSACCSLGAKRLIREPPWGLMWPVASLQQQQRRSGWSRVNQWWAACRELPATECLPWLQTCCLQPHRSNQVPEEAWRGCHAGWEAEWGLCVRASVK